MSRKGVVVGTALILLVACGGAAGTDDDPTNTAREGIPRGATPDEVFEAIMADLIERTGARADDVIIIRDEEAIWNDGSLGCPQPGQVYTQALVDGFWVVLSVGGVEYDYRAADSHFVFCPAPTPGGAPTG